MVGSDYMYLEVAGGVVAWVEGNEAVVGKKIKQLAIAGQENR